MKKQHKTVEMSAIGKYVSQTKFTSECLECPFNMSFKSEVIDYCLHECPAGRRNLEKMEGE
jgi:hypothetical protein